MKTIVIIDSFKGSLTSIEAGEAIKGSILQIHPNANVEVIPIADGGEGMLSFMLNNIGGHKHTCQVHNPCMEIINAEYGISTDGTTAFIEMASASGLPLIAEEQRNPMKTTTYGTGELIKDALEKGCTKFIIGIGGSATNDAGAGMLQALGFQFLNKEGQPLGKGGEILSKIKFIDTTQVNPLLKKAHFIVACDVKNPFYGKEGAAYVYARQKGSDDAMIKELDNGLKSFADIIRKETNKDISTIAGSGAAGGMGGGMLAFLNAELKPGADLLLELCHFHQRLADANLIITGEGRIDRQSLMGKIPGKILQIGKEANIPVIAIVGSAIDKDLLLQSGFKGIFATKPDSMPLNEAMKPDIARRNIQETVSRIFSEEINFD